MSKKQKSYLRGWAIWCLSAFFIFYKYALEVSPSVMTTTLMKAFDISATQLGNLAACYFYAYLIMQIPAGLLIDKFGPRLVTSMAIILCAFGSFMFAKADSFFLACVGRFLTGTGAAFGVVNCLKLTANWFPLKQFAFMAGLMMAFGMLGAVGGQAPLAAFIEAVEWRHAMEITSFVGLGFGVVFWLVVRDKSPLHKYNTQVASKPLSIFRSLKKILTSTQHWWLSIYSGFAFAPIMVFGGLWGVSYLHTAFGLTNTLAAQSISLVFIGYGVGAPTFGWFSDWIKRRRVVMFWGTFVAAIALTLIIYVPTLSHFTLVLLLFVFGFSISSFMLCFTMIREISLFSLAATAIGFMNSFDALFGAFSDPLTGVFLDWGWDGRLVNGARVFSLHDFKLAFILLPVYLVISLISIFFIKETYCKQQAEPASLP